MHFVCNLFLSFSLLYYILFMTSWRLLASCVFFCLIYISLGTSFHLVT